MPKNFYIGDVRDILSLRNAMHGIDYIFQAVALKQVPSCEFLPFEAVKTNVLGTENALTAAIEASFKNIVCLSTDKAAYPVNTMGTSKPMMEKVVVAKAQPQTLVMPEIPIGSFAKKLCSTYLSYLTKKKASFQLKMNCNDRGGLTEHLKTEKCGRFGVNILKSGKRHGIDNTGWEYKSFEELQKNPTFIAREMENNMFARTPSGISCFGAICDRKRSDCPGFSIQHGKDVRRPLGKNRYLQTLDGAKTLC